MAPFCFSSWKKRHQLFENEIGCSTSKTQANASDLSVSLSVMSEKSKDGIWLRGFWWWKVAAMRCNSIENRNEKKVHMKPWNLWRIDCSTNQNLFNFWLLNSEFVSNEKWCTTIWSCTLVRIDKIRSLCVNVGNSSMVLLWKLSTENVPIPIPTSMKIHVVKHWQLTSTQSHNMKCGQTFDSHQSEFFETNLHQIYGFEYCGIGSTDHAHCNLKSNRIAKLDRHHVSFNSIEWMPRNSEYLPYTFNETSTDK